MINIPQKNYQSALDSAQKDAKLLEAQLSRLSIARTIVFITTLVLIVYWANEGAGWAFTVSLVTGSMIFFFLLVRYTKKRELYDLSKATVIVNQEELHRLAGEWGKINDRFPATSPIGHPYAEDLDLFSPKASLYHLLNRCGSWLGAKKLQEWMLSPAPEEELARRHRMVQALKGNQSFQQKLQATGLAYLKGSINQKGLGEWVEQPQFILKKQALRWGSRFFPIVALTTLGITLYLGLPWFVVIFGLIGNFWVIRGTAARIKQVSEETDKQVKQLKQASYLIRVIEEEEWSDSEWIETAAIVKNDRASQSLKQLSNILYQLEARNNPWFFGLVNIWILHDVYWLGKLEKWQLRHQDRLGGWLDTLADIEALNSLAGFYHANPSYVFPQVLSIKEPLFEAVGLAHPLLSSQERVSNNFALKGMGVIGILTGSNMSGKSTFERTVGINTILALMGAPVCAQSFTLSPVQVFTSMRTQDSLEENVSGFYAELKRLEQLLKTLNNSDLPVLFLLDEILKGTNSADRNKGGKALLKQLSKKNAFGLISTHDLSLGEWAANDVEHLKNFSFNSEIIDGKLKFHYKLTEGVCHSFSATALMKEIGIQMD